MDKNKSDFNNTELLKKRLNPLQFAVTQENATEPSFRNEYWDNTREGIYVDIVSGEPLFSSLDKFDSGCGWPSFTKPMDDKKIKQLVDRSHGMMRKEVRSTDADSHLGLYLLTGHNLAAYVIASIPLHCGLFTEKI